MAVLLDDLAFAALRNLLARGDYRPGDRLPAERELASRLGLSRATVREAISRLAEAGLIQSRQGSGTYVASFDLAEVFDVRLRLEPLAASLAATRRDRMEAQRLAALVRDMSSLIDHPQGFAVADIEIHTVLAAAARHVVLADLLERLTELTRISRAVTSTSRATRVSALRDMRRVVRAVRAGDSEAAAIAMEDHIRTVRDAAGAAAPDRSLARITPTDAA